MIVKAISRFEMANTIEFYKRHYGISVLDKNKIISIYCTNDTPLFGYKHPNLLELQFDDIEDENYHPAFPNLKLYTEEQAEEAFEFIKKLKPEDFILINCYAGISRSGSHSAFIQEYHRDEVDYDQFKRDNGHIVPNLHVLKLLRAKAWGTELTYGI